MVRWIVLCTALAACAPHSSHGPAWPTPHAQADGGESLSPRVPETVAAIEESEDATKPEAAPATPAAAPATPAAPKEAGSASGGTAPTMIEEPTQIEDIVIEIDD